MARIRTIKPEFFDDEDLCALSFQHRLGFIGLWTQADKAGRMEDRPKRLKARIFPFDDLDMDGLLSDLARAGFVIRYLVDGRAYVAIKPTSWKKHQRPRPDELESQIPPPESMSVAYASLQRDESDTAESLGKEGNGKEEEGGSGGIDSSAPHAAPEPEPVDETVVMIFPTVGNGGREWGLTEAQVSTWAELYPSLDVMAEMKKALAWVAANTGRRKTAGGMPRFLVNWLSRSTNRGGGRSSPAERPFSERELQQAREWHRRVHVGCEDGRACMEQFIRQRLRLEAAS